MKNMKYIYIPALIPAAAAPALFIAAERYLNLNLRMSEIFFIVILPAALSALDL